MNKKKIKHQLKKAAYQKKIQEIKKKVNQSDWGIPVAGPHDSPEVISVASQFSMEWLYANEKTETVSRISLHEYEGHEIVICGHVDDIRKTYDKKGNEYYSLLLQQPMQLSGWGKMKPKYIDSHIWIPLTDLHPETGDKTISYGDYIIVEGTVTKYKGLVETGLRGWKYGLTHINILRSGYLSRKNMNNTIDENLVTQFPRPHILVKIKDSKIQYANDLPIWAREQHERRKTKEPLTKERLRNYYGYEVNGSDLIFVGGNK